jgi:uncharacterized phage protein gp47/JayE
MPITEVSMYRARDDILAEMLAMLTAAIPDAYVGEDGNWRITFEIQAGQQENLYLANQLLLQDMFIQTASQSALQRHGDQYGLPMKLGTKAQGTLQFQGDGATYIPIGTEVGYDPGGGLDVIFFNSTTAGTIPNPGIPTAPTLADAGAGALPAGTYEYAVTFVTASGETAIGIDSSSLAVAVNHNINLTAIPLGGPGTTARRLYRRVNGGAWGLLASASPTLANNTTTTITDTGFAATSPPPDVSTAQGITVNAEAQNTGVEGNVGVGTITVLTNTPSTLVGVTNPTAFTGGSDPEDTEDYRDRLLEWVRSPGTGSNDDLKAIAEGVSGVGSATIFENTPVAGTTTVRIAAPGGGIPSSTVIDAVQAALDAYDISNISIVVTTFNPVPTNVTVDVTTSGTYTLTDVTPSVQAAITDYINQLEVAATLKIAGIIDAVYGLAGISDIVVTTPATNQTTSAGDKRTPGTITVT